MLKIGFPRSIGTFSASIVCVVSIYIYIYTHIASNPYIYSTHYHRVPMLRVSECCGEARIRLQSFYSTIFPQICIAFHIKYREKTFNGVIRISVTGESIQSYAFIVIGFALCFKRTFEILHVYLMVAYMKHIYVSIFSVQFHKRIVAH